MKSQNTKSSDKLKSEVHQQLRKVRTDIDELQGRLSPGQLIDDAIFYKKGRSPAATLDHLKRNPIGATFLALGTLLLMEDENHTSYEANATSKLSSLKEDIKTRLPSLGKFDEFTNADETNAEGFAGMSAEAKSSKLQAAKEKLVAGLDTGKEKFHNMDNTTFMALGAGLGVLTGASLPISEAEERLVGDKFQGRMSDFNTDLRAAVNECSNILKDLVMSDVKNFDVKIF